MWLVVKTMVPPWILDIIRHLVFRGPKRGPIILTTTHVAMRRSRTSSQTRLRRPGSGTVYESHHEQWLFSIGSPWLHRGAASRTGRIQMEGLRRGFLADDFLISGCGFESWVDGV